MFKIDDLKLKIENDHPWPWIVGQGHWWMVNDYIVRLYRIVIADLVTIVVTKKPIKGHIKVML